MKKVLALMVAVLLLSLTACGDSATVSPGQNSTEHSPTYGAPAYDEPELEYGAPTYNEPEPEDVSEGLPNEEPEDTTPRLEGLIVVRRTGFNYELYCIDPNTGNTDLYASFVMPSRNPNTDPDYYSGSVRLSRWLFSEDYSKVIAVKEFMATGESHAGWIDLQGNFFDVTEALGLQSKSDFDTPPKHSSVGFVGNNFGWLNYQGGYVNPEIYSYVPMDNLTLDAVQEGNVLCIDHPYNEYSTLMVGNSEHKWYNVTDWIDANRAIVNVMSRNGSCAVNSVIADSTAGTETFYIPGDSRYNFNGVCSPDGANIAFMSMPKMSSIEGMYYDEGTPDIYITSIDGGNPIKVEGIPFSLNTKECVLIDWV